MRTVAVRLVDADFAQQMALMRDWLDCQCSEPTRFIYDQANDGVVVSVEFPNEGDAEAFAIRFDGKSRTVMKTVAGQSRQVCCPQLEADRSPNRSS
jgi:hypothetical protein